MMKFMLFLVAILFGLNKADHKISPEFPVAPLCRQQIDEYLKIVNRDPSSSEWALKSKFKIKRRF